MVFTDWRFVLVRYMCEVFFVLLGRNFVFGLRAKNLEKNIKTQKSCKN